VANWISKFLATYHGIDPQTKGTDAVSYFWGLLTIGCLLGLIFLKLFDSRSVLVWFSTAAIVCLMLALFGTRQRALVAFPLVGFLPRSRGRSSSPWLSIRLTGTTARFRESCAPRSSVGRSCRSSSAGWATVSGCGSACFSST